MAVENRGPQAGEIEFGRDVGQILKRNRRHHSVAALAVKRFRPADVIDVVILHAPAAMSIATISGNGFVPVSVA